MLQKIDGAVKEGVSQIDRAVHIQKEEFLFAQGRRLQSVPSFCRIASLYTIFRRFASVIFKICPAFRTERGKAAVRN